MYYTTQDYYIAFNLGIKSWFVYLIFSSRPQVILGVTNPFFVKTLSNWPHLIRLVDQSDGEEEVMRMGGGRSLSDGSDKPGVHTKYKPFLNRDKSFARIISSSKVRVKGHIIDPIISTSKIIVQRSYNRKSAYPNKPWQRI